MAELSLRCLAARGSARDGTVAQRLAQRAAQAKERVVEGLELLLVGLRDARENAFSLVRQRHQGPPAIDGIFLALQQATVHTALDQERGAVVAELQPLGDL